LAFIGHARFSEFCTVETVEGLVKYKWNQSSIAKGHALLFESAPSNEPLAVIGSPVLSLRLKSSRDQDQCNHAKAVVSTQ
jgi:hypothetical protein